MADSDDLYAPVQAAMDAVQAAAAQLTDAVKALSTAGVDVASVQVDADSSKLTDVTNIASDHALTSLNVATDRINTGIASLTASAQAAIARVKSAGQ